MLSARDREFFTLVSEAAFANPFGEDRDRIDRKLAGAPRQARREEVLDRLLALVRARLDGLDGLGKGLSLARYDDRDRPLLEEAILFAHFHEVAPAFDAFILKERTRTGAAGRLDFAARTLRALVTAGFDATTARRYLGLFYQLRRAYYFIEQTLPGQSRPMRELRQRLWSNVFTHDVRRYARVLFCRMEDFSTFLLGPTGTGKGIAAAAIGRSGFIPFDEKTETFSESFEDGFVSLNLSQFPETLVESELFGHRKGAFTGAIANHRGVLERTRPHGVIFLDEIGEVTIPVQIKLLRVLQERTFSPVGGHESVRFQGRVVAATNRPLAPLRATGAFRDDFYYRLSSDVLPFPTLQERLTDDPGELDLLLRFILQRQLGEDAPDVRALATRVITERLGPSYPWPGNVRELEQCVRSIILTRDYRGDVRPSAAEAIASGDTGETDESAKGLVARHCRALYARHGSYEEVARRTELDRRTVKRYIETE